MYNDIQPVIPCFIHWFMQRFCPVFVPMLGRLPWPLLQLAAVAGAVPGALLAVLISGAGALHQLAALYSRSTVTALYTAASKYARRLCTPFVMYASFTLSNRP